MKKTLLLVLCVLFVSSSAYAAFNYDGRVFTRPGAGGNFSVPRMYGLNITPHASLTSPMLRNVTCFNSTQLMVYNWSSNAFILNKTITANTAGNTSDANLSLNPGSTYGVICGRYGTTIAMYAAEIDGGNYTNGTLFMVKNTSSAGIGYNISHGLFVSNSIYNIQYIQIQNGTTIPSATWNNVTPYNVSYTFSTTPVFYFNATFSEGTFDVSLVINGTKYGTNVSSPSNGLVNITANASLTAGAEYGWYFNATSGSTSVVFPTQKLYVVGSASTLACLVVSNGCSIVSSNGCNYVQ